MTQTLSGKHILLGISGGIAAYKTPELVRQLVRAGATVQVVMTRSAREFVTTTALQAVSQHPVRDDLWDERAEAAMGHIELARWADLVLIAPATAHVMSQLATGAAGDLLSTLCLATTAPVIVAPAMNHQMWQHPATVRNCAQLEADDVFIATPDDGAQACGEFGPGRMQEPAALCQLVADRLVALDAASAADDKPAKPVLAGARVLITAGPTREPLDPVRFISNHSSGKQGFALAEAASSAGASVTVVHGPVGAAPPAGLRTIAVETAQEMFGAVTENLDEIDIFIGVAAVADYRPVNRQTQKIKKEDQSGDGLTLALVKNPDIIASVAARPGGPFTVGFAAETDMPVAQARAKRVRKGLDAIVVNDVSRADIGFNADDNAVLLIDADGEVELARQSKSEIARRLVDLIAVRYRAQLATTNRESVAK